MQEHTCCGRIMYQEIGLDNRLLSLCKVCGKTTTQRINFSGRASDDIEYFNIKLGEEKKGGS